MRRICVVEPGARGVSETFLAVQAEGLPAHVTIVYGQVPVVQDDSDRRRERAIRAIRRASRWVLRRSFDWEVTSAYVAAFRRSRAEAVLAQYGPTGVRVLPACRKTGLPLIVQFHGADATMRTMVDANRDGYQQLFSEAAAIVAGCRDIADRLISLGASPARVHVAPVGGVDPRQFALSDPASAPPCFLAVGRFVDKKAPYLTVLAFAQVYRTYPEARLRMIGDGPLRGVCADLARALGIEEAVTFLGEQDHNVVRKELSQARAFVQHSKQAHSGDREGTAISVLEGGAAGLPVVATRHAGILESIVEGETGLLVDEGDVEGMAQHMARLAADPALAQRMGRAARKRVEEHYSSEQCCGRLWSIIESCIEEHEVGRRRRNGSPSPTPQ